MKQFDLCNRVLDSKPCLSNCKELTYTLAILFIAGLCFLPGLGSFGPLDPTDSFFIEAGREMIEQQHYITALYNYADWLDKPILAFLPAIVCFKFFGMHAWAARLPAAISGIVLVCATYTFSLPVLGRRVAIFSALVLCSSPLFLLAGHISLSDELLSMLLGVAMFYIGTSLIKDQNQISLMAYLFLSLAILTKGPIALILAGITVIFFIFITCSSLSSAATKLRQLNLIIGGLLIATICLPYFIFAHSTTNGAFTEKFFLRQNLGRMLGKVNHQEPIWFYVPVLLAGYFPWIFYALADCSRLQRLFTKRQKLTQKQKLIVFCICWLLSVLLLFTLVPTKLPTYILPLSPALAILAGTYLDMLIHLSRQRPASLVNSKAAMYIWGLPFAFAFVGSLITVQLLPKLVANQMSYPNLLWLTAFSMLAPCLFFWNKKFEQGILSLFFVSILTCSLLIPGALLLFYQNQQISINKLVAIAKNQNGNIATLFSSVPSVVYAMQKPVPEIKSLSELAQFSRTGASPHLLLATKNCLNIPQLQAKQHIVANEQKWYLLNVDNYPWQDNYRKQVK